MSDGDNQTWRGAAACAGMGVKFRSAEDDFFFLLPGRKSKRAKQLCATCLVKKRCLEYALVNNLQGIWGGTTDDERREYPQYVIDAIRDRELALSRRTLIIDQHTYLDQEGNRLIVQVAQVSAQSSPVQSMEEWMGEQLEALDRLFEQTNDLLNF